MCSTGAVREPLTSPGTFLNTGAGTLSIENASLGGISTPGAYDPKAVFLYDLLV